MNPKVRKVVQETEKGQTRFFLWVKPWIPVLGYILSHTSFLIGCGSSEAFSDSYKE